MRCMMCRYMWEINEMCVGICGGFMGCRLWDAGCVGFCRRLMRCMVFSYMWGINEIYGV